MYVALLVLVDSLLPFNNSTKLPVAYFVEPSSISITSSILIEIFRVRAPSRMLENNLKVSLSGLIKMKKKCLNVKAFHSNEAFGERVRQLGTQNVLSITNHSELFLLSIAKTYF